MLTADPDAILYTQEKIRVALRNVDRVISDNEEGIKDTLLQFRVLHRLAVQQRRTPHQDRRLRPIQRHRHRQRARQDPGFSQELGSDKYGGELLPTVVSMRELVESFDKKLRRAAERYPQDAE